MVDVAAGATAMPPSVTINLTTLLATSMLGEAGGLGPFPNQAAIEKNARNQQDAALLAGLNSLLTQPGSLPAQAMATQAGQATRSITTANNVASQQHGQQAAAGRQQPSRQWPSGQRPNSSGPAGSGPAGCGSTGSGSSSGGCSWKPGNRQSGNQGNALAGVKATRDRTTRDRATRDRARAIRDNPLARIDSGSK
jgi:hypothetical protein